MTTFRKTVTATLAALTLATTFVASGAEARPRWHRGYGWGAGAGIVGALAAGAIIAGATRPSYGYGYYAAPVRSCDMVERFDRWGNVIGYRRVCGYY